MALSVLHNFPKFLCVRNAIEDCKTLTARERICESNKDVKLETCNIRSCCFPDTRRYTECGTED